VFLGAEQFVGLELVLDAIKREDEVPNAFCASSGDALSASKKYRRACALCRARHKAHYLELGVIRSAEAT
jgi:hypothetical protein